MAKTAPKLFIFFLFITIFLFWFLLSFDNFFHWDEWEIFARLRGPILSVVLRPYNEHFIPLNLLYYQILFKLFGLNYLPYQFLISLFHAVNSLLLFFITLKIVKDSRLSLLAMALFGFSSLPIENLVWSLGIDYILAGTFLFTGYWFYLKAAEHKSHLFLFASGLALFISPLFHDITLLMPFVFVILTFFSKPKRKLIFFYVGVGLINIFLLLLFSGSRIFAHTQFDPMKNLIDFVNFVFFGLTNGLIYRFFLPYLYFYPRTSGFAGGLVRNIFLALSIFSGFFFAWILARKASIRKVFWESIVSFGPFIILPYLTAAPARGAFGPYQAAISRYTYMPLFFFLLLIFSLVKKWGFPQRIVFLLALSILVLHLVADVNFSFRFWRPMVARDRQFANDVSYLFWNNSVVYDLPAPGIEEKLVLSKLWFLLPKNRSVNFVSPPTDLSLLKTPDPKSTAIYKKILDIYSRKYD